jgi:predicted nucleic acid-binding protein
MIVVDSSVWIDFFRGDASPEVDRLDELLETSEIIVGDLILTEVLQGFHRDADYAVAKQLLTDFSVVSMVGADQAILSVDIYRELRKSGVTPGKTIDVWIAAFCIKWQIPLLYSDRDFDSMRSFGLIVA